MKAFYLKEHKNAGAFTLMYRGENGDQMMGSFYYGGPVTKTKVHQAAKQYCKQLNKKK